MYSVCRDFGRLVGFLRNGYGHYGTGMTINASGWARLGKD
jgi:hypothetical protein